MLGGYDPADYEEHRLWATAEDGERVPISIVCRRGARDRRRDRCPTLLYGYGAYETSIDPYFSVARLSLLDRGAAFAIAHVRGGGEMGRRWYDDGKLLAKQHTFSDFVACARHLVDDRLGRRPRRWSPRAPAPAGCSMGAVANQAPELFGGIVAGVPFVDALTTMLDATLPLTVTEYDEWGNPEADPDVYDYIASYAPYDNVAAPTYPPILAETSLNDTRVLYVEPAKWVARLRAVALNGERRAAAHRDGGRPRRRLRALQGVARPGVHARLDPGPDGSRDRPTGRTPSGRRRRYPRTACEPPSRGITPEPVPEMSNSHRRQLRAARFERRSRRRHPRVAHSSR